MGVSDRAMELENVAGKRTVCTVSEIKLQLFLCVSLFFCSSLNTSQGRTGEGKFQIAFSTSKTSKLGSFLEKNNERVLHVKG